MAVREFDGNDDQIACDNGTITDVNVDSAVSMMMLVKPDLLNAVRPFMGIAYLGALTLASMYYPASAGGLAWGANNPDSDSGLNVGLTEDQWQVIGLNKPAGTAFPRLHRKLLGSGSWTHGQGNNQFGNSDGADAIEVCFGAFTSTEGTNTAMRLAVAALWIGTNLADADFETIESTATTVGINTFSPTALWEFNQASVATDVLDLIGSADQTSIVDTTVVEGDDPAWTFGLEEAAEKQTLFAVRRSYR